MAGLISTSAASADGDTPPIHTIAVASTCGRTFTLLHIGTLRFGNAQDQGDIPDLKIDGMIVDAATKALAGKYAVTPITLDSTDFVNGRPALIGSEPDPADFRAALEKTGTFDAYLIVSPETRGDTIGETNASFSGVGLYWHTLMFNDQSPTVFTACRLSLVDGHTFKVIDERWLAEPRHQQAFGDFLMTISTNKSGVYYLSVGDQAWADTIAALTPLNKEIIQYGLSSLLDGEMPATLQKLKLLP